MQPPSDELATLAFDESTPGFVVEWRGDEYEFPLEAADLIRRRGIVDDALAIEGRRASSSYWRTGDPGQDASCARVLTRWAEVGAWDYWNVVGPVLGLLRGSSATLLFPGCAPVGAAMEGFTVRRALEYAVRCECISVADARRLPSLPLWAGYGVTRLMKGLSGGRLPDVVPARTTLALLPPPPGAVMVAADLLERWGIEALHDSAEQLRSGLARDVWITRLLDTLTQEARATGITVETDVTAVRLLELLAGSGASGHECTLVVVGHQGDDARLHCADRALGLDEIAWNLRSRTPIAWTSIDLAVCHASEPYNLAELCQAAGCPVVLSRGPFAYYGRTVGAWILIVRMLAHVGAAPLSWLHDTIWTE